MKFLFHTLVLTSILVVLSSVYSRSQPGGADDSLIQEEVTTQLNESGPEPVKEIISKPRAIYNYLMSHYDDGLVFETKNGNFRVRSRTRVQFQFSVTDQDSNSTDTDFFLRRLRL
ncbi:MAG: hypothetical protein KAI07_00610, partial [Deltaproteobacteria bacterium]|nr:hypothetical protein [Deltaproteobacteria bacterium]